MLSFEIGEAYPKIQTITRLGRQLTKPGSTLSCRVDLLCKSECNAVPSKKRLARLTQALPDTRIIPRIEFLSRLAIKKGQAPSDKKVHPDIADRLCEIAMEAYAAANKNTAAAYRDVSEPLAVAFAPVRALDAANHFVSERAFETNLPNFRKLVADGGKLSLKRAVIELLERMPPSGSPPFPQMRELAAAEWRESLNPAVVRDALDHWVKLMNDLSNKAGRGRSPVTAEKNFVSALAHYWKEELGAEIVNSRSRSASQPKLRSSHPHEQRGLFADFVRVAAKIIPKTYRPGYWDQAIRKAIEQKP